jgi:hypothetical protein
MGGRFASFDANKSYLMGAIAQIDSDDTDGAFANLTRCLADIDPEGLSTPIDADHPDYARYQKLNQIIVTAKSLLESSPEAARQELATGLREFGWADEVAGTTASGGHP